MMRIACIYDMQMCILQFTKTLCIDLLYKENHTNVCIDLCYTIGDSENIMYRLVIDLIASDNVYKIDL